MISDGNINHTNESAVTIATMKKHHIVLFPYMAQGHITPFLTLASLIQRLHPSFSVTVASIPANIPAISSSLPPSSPVHLRSLPFSPTAHGLPADTKTTETLPFPHLLTLFQASESLLPAFENLISDITATDGTPPLAIIADNFLGWTTEVARKFNCFHSTFITGGAYGTAVFMSLWCHLPHTATDADPFPLPDFPDVHIHRSQLPHHLLTSDSSNPWAQFLKRHISYTFNSDSILVNTVEEFETKGLAMLRKLASGIPIFPIGPLLRLPGGATVNFLDQHTAKSVVYISFGSQNTIREEQMMELAKGVEASGQPFIWVIRPPYGQDKTAEFKQEWLPEGFDKRVTDKKQGFMVYRWAPQVEILRHPSTGAFLSHCGWNSVLESLSSGVPIIGWPLSADQLYNSTMLEEEGVSLEVARGNTEWSKVENGKVERVIRVVLGGTEKGREMRRKAEAVAVMLKVEEGGRGEGMGPGVKGLTDFVQAAIERKDGA